MLRLIGAIVVALLIVCPFLDRAGVLGTGLLHDLAALELRAFDQAVAWTGSFVHRNTG